MNYSLFFQRISTKEQIMCKIFEIENIVDYVNGELSVNILVENEQSSLRVFAFDKDVKISKHVVSTYACVYVIEGVIEFSIDNNKYLLSKGEMLIIPPNIEHAVCAQERSKMMLIRI